MPRIGLIHWDAAEAGRYLTTLREAGYDVDYHHEFSPQRLREWRASPPDAFLIDLSRLPSHGREIAVALRQSKLTRAVPIVFCDGADDKVAKTREFLPDAIFCKVAKLKGTLRTANRLAPKTPIVPSAMMERYAGRSTAQKLGIREGDAVMLCHAARDMPAALGELPARVTFVEDAKDLPAVTLLFVVEPDDLRQNISELRPLASQTKLWVCWKKGKSAVGGVSENLIRDTGIALGLVDYKVCSVSDVWSGLLFAAKSPKK